MAKKVKVPVKKPYNLGTSFFVFGAVLAVLGGIAFPGGAKLELTSVLIVFGLIVGFLNISLKETNSFLLASISLVIMSALGGAVLVQVPSIGIYLESILISLLTFVIPAGIIVALKSIYRLEES